MTQIDLNGEFNPSRHSDASSPLDRQYWPEGKDWTRAYNLARLVYRGFGNMAEAVEQKGWIWAVLAVPNCGRKSTPLALAMLHHLGLFDLAKLAASPEYSKGASIAAKEIENFHTKGQGAAQ